MKIESNIKKNFDEHVALFQKLFDQQAIKIKSISEVLANCLRDSGTIFWCGNGGSASDSQHLAAEFVGRFKKDRRALRSIALTTDTSVITCIANDYDYSNIFSRQVEALGRPGDALVVISTSGKSQNIMEALATAKKMKITTIALLGKGGGNAKDLADYSIIVDSDTTARIQESHIFLGHLFCELVEGELGFV